jgi:hypothetical protein
MLADLYEYLRLNASDRKLCKTRKKLCKKKYFVPFRNVSEVVDPQHMALISQIPHSKALNPTFFIDAFVGL